MSDNCHYLTASHASSPSCLLGTFYTTPTLPTLVNDLDNYEEGREECLIIVSGSLGVEEGSTASYTSVYSYNEDLGLTPCRHTNI